MPGKPENRESMKGEPKHQDRGQAGKGSIKSEEKVGSSGPHGIQFGIPPHPDKSVMSPED
jgi:hypothetical protein